MLASPLNFSGLQLSNKATLETVANKLDGLLSLLESLQAKIGIPVSSPPYLQIPPDGIPFNFLGWTTIGAIGAQVVVVSFEVPGGMNGAIKWIGNSYLGPEFVEGTGSVIWQVLANGQPINDFENILGSLGSPSSPSETAPIRVYESQTIQLVLINVGVAAAGQLLGGRLSGWFYPIEYDERGTPSNEPDQQ